MVVEQSISEAQRKATNTTYYQQFLQSAEPQYNAIKKKILLSYKNLTSTHRTRLEVC